jgi:hypothetical protein
MKFNLPEPVGNDSSRSSLKGTEGLNFSLYQPVCDDRFKVMIQKKYGIKMGLTRRGRPKVID